MSVHYPAHFGPDKSSLNRRLEEAAWALLLIMTGVIWLLPHEQIPRGTWLIAAGVILLGVNAARAMNQIRISVFTSVLGAVALVGGVAELSGVDLPLFAIFLVLLGASILVRALMVRDAAAH